MGWLIRIALDFLLSLKPGPDTLFKTTDVTDGEGALAPPGVGLSTNAPLKMGY